MITGRAARTVLLGFLLCTVAPLAASAQDVEWFADLYPDNRDYLVVYVDARELSGNVYLQSVSFDVAMRDPEGNVADRTFRFTDDEVPRLESGVVHRRYFAHELDAVEDVRGEVLRYLAGVEGALPFANPDSVTASPSFDPADAAVVGSPPPAGEPPGESPLSDELRCEVEFLTPRRGDGYDLSFAVLELSVEGAPEAERTVTGSMRFFQEWDRPPDREPTLEMRIAGQWSGGTLRFHDEDTPSNWFFAGVVVTDDGVTRMAGREFRDLEDLGLAHGGLWSGDCPAGGP